MGRRVGGWVGPTQAAWTPNGQEGGWVQPRQPGSSPGVNTNQQTKGSNIGPNESWAYKTPVAGWLNMFGTFVVVLGEEEHYGYVLPTFQYSKIPVFSKVTLFH